ncbi:DEAD/DEAH box helicase [Pseudonocardia abyssalis]|uniref:ATP-dependent helicase n=1 Tax=Pseudonocardia abyssalis TaxID=2792008 RepID=A0ABS6URE1_9PSEU|nr:DEAD/DEAH box helicase [Pseudonocardia abyssalis]MBW0115544.1 ATP-dependent helicase [Pseudonocardia abyssalis]MBW0134501.1 ATP-dependent helicase [Pseudonocardia abyssalis]
MLAVHALWSPGRGVLIWAEDGERPATGSSRSLRSARPHPFAVSSAGLAALHPGKATTVSLLLPSRAGGPLASPELVRARDTSPRGGPVLRPWSVPALVVDVAELEDPVDEVRYGASVTHLRAVAATAADLVARGRVLPTLVAGEARWRPVVQGLDAVAVDTLASAMPPVGRAEHTGTRTELIGPDPGALVADALAVLVDTGVRDRLARTPEPITIAPARRSRSPVTEAWLAALLTPDARVDAGEREQGRLADELAAWDAFGTAPTGEGRASFRLVEERTLHDPSDPGEDLDDQTGDGTRWVLEFLLQSSADPSLQIPAEQVWDGAAARLIAEPQELLLAELGRAAQVVPSLADALRSARPSRHELDLDGAHRFLTSDAALLVGAGFGVQLPAGWDGARTVGLTLSARSTPTDGVITRGGLGREELADFAWSLAVGDEELSEEEIGELVAAKAPLVRLRGRWVSVDADRLRAGLEFLATARRRGRAPTVAEVLAVAQQHPDDQDAPLPVAVRTDGWIGDLLAGRAETALAPIPPIPGFRAELRPYQQRGVAWLAFLARLGLGACLADDMGLGKTVQLLALEAHERRDTDPGPTLLLCPMSLVGTWQREAAKFAPGLRIHAHHGPGRPRGAELTEKIAASDLVVTTYATATRDVEDLESRPWHRLVLDEAQAVKNSRATHAQAVRRFVAGHRVALTGTPVENRLSELWSLMDVLNPGLLGTSEKFRARYAIPVERHGSTEAAELLRRVTRPYLLRRLKTDPTIIDDLPEKIEITQHYRLTREQASLYRTVVDDMMEKIEDSQGIERRGNVLAAMTKLKQVCNHPAQLLHDGSAVGRRSGKIIRLEEILGEILDEGDRVLCFTQFTEFGHLLVPHLSARFDTDVAYLHGGTPKKRRDEMVARFQAGEGAPVLLLSLKAGGTGLTLTAANHVVHLDRWWNPAVENQATDRAFRIGQKRNVQVRKFVCPGTVEERVDEMITKKKALSEMVVGDGEGWLTELSTESLREVFALGSEALEDVDG